MAAWSVIPPYPSSGGLGGLSRGNIIGSVLLGPIMKEIDDTPVKKSESELTVDVWFEVMDRLEARIEALEVRVADLHHRRRVSRQQAVDQDPEWF